LRKGFFFGHRQSALLLKKLGDESTAHIRNWGGRRSRPRRWVKEEIADSLISADETAGVGTEKNPL